jgi:hypothetical protein
VTVFLLLAGCIEDGWNVPPETLDARGTDTATTTTETGVASSTSTGTASQTGTATQTSTATQTATGTQTATAIRVAVVSDLNDSYGSTTYGTAVHDAVRSILDDPPDVVLSTGDMVAGQQSGLDYRAMWRGFHAAVSDPLARAGIPFAVTPGNHDASGYASFSAERSIFEDEWLARKPDLDWVDDSDYPLRYAFTVGDTLFVSLDDTTVGALSSAQRTWLDGVLDTPATVRIVYGHVPLYPFAIGRESEALFDDTLEDLLVAHGVQLFVSGHHHAYYPGKRGSLRLVGTSCLGSGARNLIGTSSTSPKTVLRFTVEGGAITGLDAYGGSDFTTPVARSSLPTSVGSGADRITRDDR